MDTTSASNNIQKKKKPIYEAWMQDQLNNESLQEGYSPRETGILVFAESLEKAMYFKDVCEKLASKE
ncbi:hypothetical protein OCK74_06005 [Chitinophagaceae bacterium LB-8]|uniref:Uncharacterized protein n=1 Tax=Paraflavisolibacter caeni TaxID=2982496 RepID=A0A9X3B7N3_9BACT|nr:hypothetical protein [Paraflavisolibacter caeni]MCU7548661.1 hypothetical protein [Paraflavisolibacter caeni]